MQKIWFSSFSNRSRNKITVKLIGYFNKYNFHLNDFLFNTHTFILGLGDMAQKIITIIIFISVDIDNYHDKCQIFISFKFKARCLLQSESFRNQTINSP